MLRSKLSLRIISCINITVGGYFCIPLNKVASSPWLNLVEFHIPVLFENAHMREALIGFFVCPGWGWGGGGYVNHKVIIPSCISSTLGARDVSSAVSGFCQVFIVTRAASAYGRRCVGLQPNTENSRRTREKPLVPRVHQQLPGLRVSWSHVYLLIIAHFPAVHMQAVTAKMFKEGMRIEAKHVKKWVN